MIETDQAFDITETEYRKARKLSRDVGTSPEHSNAYWHLCRCYHGQIFIREQAALAIRLIRGLEKPPVDEEAT